MIFFLGLHAESSSIPKMRIHIKRGLKRQEISRWGTSEAMGTTFVTTILLSDD